MDVGENNPTLERIQSTDIIKIPNNLLTHEDLPNTTETLINVIFPNILFFPPIINLYSADIVKNDDNLNNNLYPTEF